MEFVHFLPVFLPFMPVPHYRLNASARIVIDEF